MNHHYVLAPHDPVLAARAVALVEAHRPGHGVRAVATASRPGDFGHVIALQAADDAGLQSLLDELQVAGTMQTESAPTTSLPSAPLMVSGCGGVPCEHINSMFNFVPSKLPACAELAFLLVELKRDIHQVAADFTPPPVESHLAGIALAGGDQLLLELANDDAEQLAHDLERVTAHADVLAVRTVHAAGPNLVRSPHG